MSRFQWGSVPLFAFDDKSATLVAAVNGSSIWITDIFVECGADTTMQLLDSNDSVVFPAVNKANMPNLAAPIKLGSGLGLKCIKSGTNNAVVWVGYYLENANHV